MKIFLAYAFRNEDKPLAAEVAELLRSHGMEMVTGENLGGGALTPEVQARIDACDGLIALLTRRDPLAGGGWTTHDWVKDELTYARSKGKRAIAIVEDGVAVGGMFHGNERIPLADKAQPDPALLKLSKNLLVWQRPVVGRLVAHRLVLMVLAGLAIGAVAAGFFMRQAVNTAVGQADLLLRSGSYSAALPGLEGACTKPLGGPICRMLAKAQLGAMLETAGDHFDAEAFAQELEKLRPSLPADDPDLLLFDGAMAVREHDQARQAAAYDKADKLFRQAIERRQGHFPEARFHLGHLLLRRGDLPGAKTEFEKALAEVPEATHIRAMLAYTRLQGGDLRGATDDLRTAADGGLLDAVADLAPLLWQQGRLQEAADRLDDALKKMRDAPTGRNRLPWGFEFAVGKLLVLREQAEKTCYLRLERQATAALMGQVAQPEREGCGAHASKIAAAVAGELLRATVERPEAEQARAFAQRLAPPQ